VNGTHDNTPIRNRVVDGEPQRFCKIHQGWWPLRLFVRHTKGQGGYLGYCRACRNGTRKHYQRSEAYKTIRKAQRRARYHELRKCGMSSREIGRVL
jgi:hypothetical protein